MENRLFKFNENNFKVMRIIYWKYNISNKKLLYVKKKFYNI